MKVPLIRRQQGVQAVSAKATTMAMATTMALAMAAPTIIGRRQPG
jgi:hypothetical protein